MKKRLLFILLVVLTLNSYSQIKFEKGYFIKNNGDKVECFIKNLDWKNNPNKFEYRLSDGSTIRTAEMNEVKEFIINSSLKYVRFKVDIDRSVNAINGSDYNRTPEFKEEELFLKVLIEGHANLYFYQDGRLARFFYSKNNSDLEQLVHKTYRTKNNSISENNYFRQQLFNELNCDVTVDNVKKLPYKRYSLIDYFISYNSCSNSVSKIYNKEKKDLFNLTFRPRVKHTSLSIENGVSSTNNTEFQDEITFAFGLEFELIMPFNNNKWSFTIEPTYQYYKSTGETASDQNVSVDYKSIEIPLGMRHYMYINDDSKLFVNGALIFDISNSRGLIDFESSIDLDITTGNNLTLGIGYKFKDKYSLELNYQTGREILNEYSSWGSSYKSISIIFGYSIF